MNPPGDVPVLCHVPMSNIDAPLSSIDAMLSGIDAMLSGIDAMLSGIDARLAGIDPPFGPLDVPMPRIGHPCSGTDFWASKGNGFYTLRLPSRLPKGHIYLLP